MNELVLVLALAGGTVVAGCVEDVRFNPSGCAVHVRGRWQIDGQDPNAETCGNIALVEDGDEIEIDIPTRSRNRLLGQRELAERRAAMEALPAELAWQPKGNRSRMVTRALKAYAAFATSADRGGFRDVG